MNSIALLTTPHAPTNSDRRHAQHLSQWRHERDAARRDRKSLRRPRLRLRIAG
jgi:hypothetical protein